MNEESNVNACYLCGSTDCRTRVEVDGKPVWKCVAHEAQEEREQHNIGALVGTLTVLAGSQFGDEDVLSVVAHVMHFAGRAAKENVESLQWGLKAAEAVFERLEPHLPAWESAPARLAMESPLPLARLIYGRLSGASLTLGEGLSILAHVMLLVGRASGESVDSLQEILRRTEASAMAYLAVLEAKKLAGEAG